MKYRCSKCKQIKSEDNFSKDITQSRGRSYQCKTCASAIIKKAGIKYRKSKKYINQRKRSYLRNKEQHRISGQKRHKERIREDLIYNLICNNRSRVWAVLKGKSKSRSTLQMLGCTKSQLKVHLESQFQKGMSWDNYGEWHVDHKRPCASFDLSKKSEQEQCFNYLNLQPLWAIDNLIKSDKYEE